MRNFLKLSIQVIFFILLVLMFLVNIRTLNLYKGITLVGGLAIGFLFYKYRKKEIVKKIIKIIAIVLFVFGVLLRLYLVNSIEFSLTSDFELYYDTAVGILNKTSFADPYYLSFNGYVCIFSSILAFIFRLFGESIMTAHIFNLFVQIGTVYFIYLILKRFVKKEYALLFSVIWFSFPTVVEAMLLVSTETLFMLLLAITVYYYFEVRDKEEINFKNILRFAFLGILISASNNIRPVMAIFIIALIIDYIINSKKVREFLFLGVTLVMFVLCNSLFNYHAQNVLGDEPLRKGAMAWSLYFGANTYANGLWNPDDTVMIWKLLAEEDGNNLLLKATLDRYKELGPRESLDLFSRKFNMLWSDVNANYVFLLVELKDNNVSSHYKTFFEILSYAMVIVLIVFMILNTILEIKEKNFNILFLELFSIGYILSNLLVVLNGRYNYPMYLFYVIIGACFVERIMDSDGLNYIDKFKNKIKRKK